MITKLAKKTIIIFIIFLALLATLSCIRQHKDESFFRHRWWSYYKRGLSYFDNQTYQEAIIDFRNAIKQREKDQRMARTYGMHFIDYFPHREMGIIHYHIGDLEAARTELEISIRHYPSAKARFYLDRVRKGLIEHEATIVFPPQLTLNVESDEIWTREDPIEISGIANDDNYVSSITINRSPLFLEESKKSVHFKKNLNLTQGEHTVEIEAKNLVGKVKKAQMIFHVDREGPVIAIDELLVEDNLAGAERIIRGSLYDKSGVANLVINDQTILIKEGNDVPFTHKIPLDRSYLDLLVNDKLGNQTSAHVILPHATTNRMPIRVACAERAADSIMYSKLFGKGDSAPPIINLNGWTESQSVFLEKIYLDVNSNR